MHRPTHRRRAGIALAVGCAFAAMPVMAQAQGAGAAVPANAPLVVLLHGHVARAGPDAHAQRIESVAARRPLTHVRTVLPVLGEATAGDGKSWVHVRLPGRPNSHAGWIATDHTRRTSTSWQISVKLAARRVTVYLDGRAVRRFSVVVGAPSTPTPRGRFFVEEAVALSARASGAPFALATSARSSVLQEFDGGPGQIALHGMNNLAGAQGTASSHGCIRLSTVAITWLARHVGSGTPLTIS